MQVKDKKTGKFISQPKLKTNCFFCNKVLVIYPSARRTKNFCNKKCKGQELRNRPPEQQINWKGGKIKIHGYIFIKYPQHPFATKQGYVREHRLVMEQHLGRYLNPTEVVHHLNEIKSDNRIENLELLENNQMHIFTKHKRTHNSVDGKFM